MPQLFLILFLLFSVCDEAAKAQTLDLSEILEVHGLAGMSVATRCGSELSLEVHAGFRDIDDGWEVESGTTFRMASISKAVVALAAAKLAEQETLDLSAPLGLYLEDPPFHPSHPEVALTVRHLLTHTSGIRDGSGYSDFLSASYNEIPDVPSLSSVLQTGGAYYTSDMWGAAEPGAYFQYANLNFGVLATVMEAATGLRFDQLMEALLFGPYGLDAGFRVQDLDNIADLAVLYRQVDGQWVPQADHYNGVMPTGPDWSEYLPGTNAVAFSPQGGLRISARDLTQLARLWSTGSALGAEGAPLTLLGPEALGQLQSPQWSYDGSNGNPYYGLFNQWADGLHLAASGMGADEVIPDVAVSPFIGHPGEAYGLISDAYATPGGEWNFVFVTNGKWDGYGSGDASAFYQVEQDVFAALKQDLLTCLAQQVDAPSFAHWHLVGNPRAGDTLLMMAGDFQNTPALRFHLFDATGRKRCEGRVPPNGTPIALPVPSLTPGIHFLSLEGKPGEVSRLAFLVAG